MSERDNGTCPECGGREWATHSDGLGDVASTAAVCASCHYVTAATVDLGQNATENGSDTTRVIPPGSPTHESAESGEGMDRG